MTGEAKIQNLKAQLTHVYWREKKAYPFILYSSETKTTRPSSCHTGSVHGTWVISIRSSHPSLVTEDCGREELKQLCYEKRLNISALLYLLGPYMKSQAQGLFLAYS